jgi:serine/threonine-protein kinase
MTAPDAAERFRRADAVFDAALDLPVDERDAYVALTCGADAELGQAVRRLLEAQRSSGGFLESPAVELAAPLFHQPNVSPSSTAGHVGPFRIVREIGHGGMGTVYLGERDDGQFAQRVAIKLIREGSALFARFLEERRILALLEHPRIARIVDGGIADDGMPWFAMEYVEGQPIDRYCDEQRLSLPARLELFDAVCDAVQYAHQHLVVHRDLKPSNILVTADGQLKLLDFGIAKLVDPRATDQAAGQTIWRAMTPEYAAPEQVRGQPVSTATDVYALGVLLYVLLTGRRPYEVRDKSAAEAERIICDIEPLRPSAMAVPSDDASRERHASRAAARRTTPDQLVRALRGDLDVIVMQALRKDPARRYQSATALREDLARYLHGRPVSARPDSASYRLSKFLRRHVAGAVATAVVTMALLGATAVSVRGMREARRQRDEARVQRDRARFEQQHASASTSFMEAVLQSVPPGRPYTVRELLDRGRALLEHDYKEDPRFVARMLMELSEYYSAFFDQTDELALLQRATTIATQARDDETAALGQCTIARWKAQWVDPTAHANLDSGTTHLDRVHDAAARARMTCLIAKAQITTNDGHPASAEPIARQAVAVMRAADDTTSPEFVDALEEVQTQLSAQYRWRDALEAQRAITATLERIGRGNTVRMFETRSKEAVDLKMLGEFRSADSTLTDALRMVQRADASFGTEESLGMIGDLALELGRPDSAIVAYDRGIAAARASNESPYLQSLVARSVWALVDAGRGRRARAVLTERESTPPRMRRGVPEVFEASIVEAAGDSARASRMYVAAWKNNDYPDDGTHAPFWHRIVLRAARAALGGGDPLAADSLARTAIRLSERLQQSDSRSGEIGQALLVLARARLAERDTSGARAQLERAVPGLEYGLGPGHRATQQAKRLLASLANR